MGWPVIILGVICLVFWLLGAWFRKIANQSADFCERVVEAQFAAHTKSLKSRRREQDAEFLAERVIDPEMLLRSADDRLPDVNQPGKDEEPPRTGRFLFENRELAFLRNVRLLYQDYLDGSPLHRSDTKASVQLLGNLALSNLRRSHLGHLLRESRTLDRLDLSRSGGLFGGPYLWFNYITRMLVQETAILILDYNRNADSGGSAGVLAGFGASQVSLLAGGPAQDRSPRGLDAGTGDTEPASVGLSVGFRDGDCQADHAPNLHQTLPRGGTLPSSGCPPARRDAGEFLETVEFTAVDFLADDIERDAEIRARFGPQVAELVRRDREQNVRRAFQSFPLHELPLAARTINPATLYETYLAGGRVLLLPFRVARAFGKAVWIGVRSILRVVREILNPQVDRQRPIPSDTYWAALRKIHRMRKPVFMGSLWLRARFDVEYLGLPLPTAPRGHRRPVPDGDRPRLHRCNPPGPDHRRAGSPSASRPVGMGRPLARPIRLDLRRAAHLPGPRDSLPGQSRRRGAASTRGRLRPRPRRHRHARLVDRRIEAGPGPRRRSDSRPRQTPHGSPGSGLNLRKLWHPVHRCKRPVTDLFELPCFAVYNRTQHRRILRYLRRHHRAIRGWIKVVLGQGAADPWATVKARMRDVLLRTDLWSDQILVLRAVQTLTMLDLQHNCELVWSLGGYTRSEPGGAEPDAQPPGSLLHREDQALSAAH